MRRIAVNFEKPSVEEVLEAARDIVGKAELVARRRCSRVDMPSSTMRPSASSAG